MYHRSYHQRVLKHDAPQKKTHRFPWKTIGISLGGALLLVALIWILRAPRLQVTNVTVEGTAVADPIEISQFVLDTLSGRYLYILPKTSIILVSPDAIARSIKARYPRFKSVSVDRDSMHSLMVRTVEYPGVYLWCDEREMCSFMDETGTVFADAPYFSGSAYLKVYIGTRAPYPFVPITEAQLSQITHIYERLSAIDIKPVSVTWVSDKTLVATFIHRTTRAEIRFDPSADIDAQLETLYSGLRTQPLARMYHSTTSVLEYLDVRFDNKVVYKFQ